MTSDELSEAVRDLQHIFFTLPRFAQIKIAIQLCVVTPKEAPELSKYAFDDFVIENIGKRALFAQLFWQTMDYVGFKKSYNPFDNIIVQRDLLKMWIHRHYRLGSSVTDITEMKKLLWRLSSYGY